MKQVAKILANKQLQRVLIYGVIIIVIIYLLKKSGNFLNTFLAKLKYDIFGAIAQDGSQGQYPGGTDSISEQRKAVLQGIAKDMHDAINSYSNWIGESASDEIEKFNALNDVEFIYAYESYITQFNSNPYVDVDWEFLPGTDIDEQFMQRAKKLGLPIS